MLVLTLGLQIHMAPRGLRCYCHCLGQILPHNGIIAGCTQSTTFAKVNLKVVLHGALGPISDQDGLWDH